MKQSSKISTIATFGTWQVREDGSLFETVNQFTITSDRITEPDYWQAFSLIPNFSYNDFIPALQLAMKTAGIEKLTIKFF